MTTHTPGGHPANNHRQCVHFPHTLLLAYGAQSGVTESSTTLTLIDWSFHHLLKVPQTQPFATELSLKSTSTIFCAQVNSLLSLLLPWGTYLLETSHLQLQTLPQLCTALITSMTRTANKYAPLIYCPARVRSLRRDISPGAISDLNLRQRSLLPLSS